MCDDGFRANQFQQGCLKTKGEQYGRDFLTGIKQGFDQFRKCYSDDEDLLGNQLSKDDENYTKIPECRNPNWNEFCE